MRLARINRQLCVDALILPDSARVPKLGRLRMARGRPAAGAVGRAGRKGSTGTLLRIDPLMRITPVRYAFGFGYWPNSVLILSEPTEIATFPGWGQEEDRRRSQEAGFDYHLTKPADPEALQRLLGEVQ
jgi:hypothetical protein